MSRLSHRALFQGNVTLSSAGLAAYILLGYAALNLFGMWVAREWSFDRPLFNLDYLLAGLVYVWISRSVAALLMVALFLTEFIRYLLPTYFFSRQAFSVLFWLRAAENWAPSVQFAVVLGIIVLVLLLAVIFRRYRLSRRNKIEATVWILGLAILLIAADGLNGTSSFIRISSGINFVGMNVAGSPAYVVGKKTWDTLRGEPSRYTPLKLSESATGRYFSNFLPADVATNGTAQDLKSFPITVRREQLPNKIVLVVFESLSVMNSNLVQENWQQPFKRLENRYTLESGTLDWSGATFRGEVRELCWSSKDGVLADTLPLALPTVMKGLGYESSSFHGFYKTMFDRDRLYPILGFDHSVFLDEMRKDGDVPLTGTLFHGAQDAYVASLVHREILRPGKRFVYWLTLSSHVPVNIPFAKQIATPDELAAAPSLPPAIWGYTVICRKTLDSIADIAADESLTNCDFIIVGDHSLPLSNSTLRKYYFPNRIPYLILHCKKPDAPQPPP